MSTVFAVTFAHVPPARRIVSGELPIIRVSATKCLLGNPLVEEAQQSGRCLPVADGHVLGVRGTGDPVHPALRQPLTETREVEHPGTGPHLEHTPRFLASLSADQRVDN